MVKSELVIPKVWRSELQSVTLFFFFSVLAVVLSRHFPGSVLTASLFTVGSSTIYLTLPLWWFLPFFTLMGGILRIYNVRYVVDNRGIEARIGILSTRQSVTRVRYEDIRNFEINQTILGRILDYGIVEISTSASDGVEVIMEGVASPEEVKDMLERERDKRQKAQRNNEKRIYAEQAIA